VGVNRAYLSRLEKGASYPGLEIIARLATVLEVERADEGPTNTLWLRRIGFGYSLAANCGADRDRTHHGEPPARVAALTARQIGAKPTRAVPTRRCLDGAAYLEPGFQTRPGADLSGGPRSARPRRTDGSNCKVG